MTLSIETRSTAGLLALTALRGVGAVTAERIAHQFELLEEIPSAALARLCEVASQAVVSSLRSVDSFRDAIDSAFRVLDEADRLDVQVISIFDPQYPSALKRISDRPPVLFIKGSVDGLDRCAACIGTREPSEFGAQVAQRVVEELVAARWTIVSGLALGIDSIAHKATLAGGGRTIAVMAGGLDSIYPKQNAQLADDILANGGTLVSEQTFGTPAIPRNLVQRDRLQSGLSVGTFVMQTDVRGGSMHTVRFTLLQGRLLFAPVPQGRHADEIKSRGILALSRLNGMELSALLQAEGEYKRLLETTYRDRPVCYPLIGREDYASMMEMLENDLPIIAQTQDTKPTLLSAQQGLF